MEFLNRPLTPSGLFLSPQQSFTTPASTSTPRPLRIKRPLPTSKTPPGPPPCTPSMQVAASGTLLRQRGDRNKRPPCALPSKGGQPAL